MDVATVRRLVPGDEDVLRMLAVDAEDFDLAHPSGPDASLPSIQAEHYLRNDGLRHWVAEVGGAVVGELLCHALPLPRGEGGEVLLYSIGVRTRWRRRGVGSALIREMDAWMKELGFAYVWVLADNAKAVEFYRSCGFTVDPEGEGALMLSREGLSR
jgi:ribosomal protein S18 acetylase RimI-like enzyme